MSRRPLLFLDVDGVLNPYGYARLPTGFVTLRSGEDPVVLCRDHAPWIRELGTCTEVVWASAWNDEANAVIASGLGIDGLPVVTMPAVPFPPEAKIGRIDGFAGDRPLAWMDDQLGYAAPAWALARRAPTLLVPIEPAVGMTRAAVDTVLAWARALHV